MPYGNEKMSEAKLDSSVKILRDAIEAFNPTHFVSMVSGGKDSAASDQVARELGVKIDFVMHGNTRCGIEETSQFVRATYGSLGDYAEADAGTAYEDYVLRKGFFGKGISAHSYAYRVLKATPFRKAISKNIRKGKRDIRILLLNGARKDESENRQKHLQVWRQDPAALGNIWVNLIHDWSQDDRDAYLDNRGTPINPVATALCRSGECMCGTMQDKAERTEAAVLYPRWGRWLAALEAEAKRLHGFGWGDPFPKKRDPLQGDFFPMCKDCMRAAA
jgi:3'-phosphoadenosine 5'-phosphosulfate sulfotransferase (PAPS reductase)/FAD synthetase